MTRAVAYAGVLAVFLSAGFLAARHLNTLTPGLAADYASTGTSAPLTPPGGTIDLPPLSTAIASRWHGAPPDSFNVTWTGQIWISRPGHYTFAVNADRGASLFVDGQAIFDNLRHPEDQYSSNAVDLTAGAHAVFIAYSHAGGAARFDLLWAPPGEALSAVPASALQPRRAGTVSVHVAQVLATAPIVLGWIWAALLTAFGAAVVLTLAGRLRRALTRAGVWRSMRWILAGSLALDTVGVWWGLPAAWAPIELTPTFVLDFIAHHFANGWYDAYPPLQYYFLSAAISPLIVLQRLSGVVIDDVGGHTLMVLIFRSLSLLAATGTVACASLATAEAFGRRAGLFAAAVFALTASFVFYAKTANVDVPYIFWFAVSMVLLLRMVRRGRMRDYVLFAAAAACAVCTKDQAYGFYVLVPFVVLATIWSENRRNGLSKPIGRACVDRRILAAAATAAICFAVFHNLLFNVDGFRQHIAFITGPGSQEYRVYEPTLAGRVSLLALTLRLIGESMGWPLCAVALAGAVVAVARRDTRTIALVLVVPVVSYYAFFIDVVLYNYDRFVIPICFVLASFAGLALDRALASKIPRSAVVTAVAAVFAYTLIYAATVDYLMVDDSRYAATAWMHARIGQAVVAASEPPEVLPGLGGFRSIGLDSIEELEREKPTFFILNVDYARAAEPGSPWAALIEGLAAQNLGYRTVARFRNPVPWPWLPLAHPDLVGPREGTIVFSVLHDINPTIEIYERR
ncbi:MAG TPA: PA14 domain-containing protein [Vicinamibacterales bacterium]|nr:PA14 domain-containing protein [Vicinamibacterales bacterium]